MQFCRRGQCQHRAELLACIALGTFWKQYLLSHRVEQVELGPHCLLLLFPRKCLLSPLLALFPLLTFVLFPLVHPLSKLLTPLSRLFCTYNQSFIFLPHSLLACSLFFPFFACLACSSFFVWLQGYFLSTLSISPCMHLLSFCVFAEYKLNFLASYFNLHMRDFCFFLFSSKHA